jgi:CheY-like chemotaxis protein
MDDILHLKLSYWRKIPVLLRRQAPRARLDVPIIVLSAHAMTNDRDQALAAGGDDFDTKPVRFQQLLSKIESLMPKGVIE